MKEIKDNSPDYYNMRDEFASKAMQALLDLEHTKKSPILKYDLENSMASTGEFYGIVAYESYLMADAMIIARKAND